MPRAVSAAATARSVVAPLRCTCRMTGATVGGIAELGGQRELRPAELLTARLGGRQRRSPPHEARATDGAGPLVVVSLYGGNAIA
jgi:hypothetical protein